MLKKGGAARWSRDRAPNLGCSGSDLTCLFLELSGFQVKLVLPPLSLGSSWLQLPASAWYFPKKNPDWGFFKRLQGDAWATAPLSCEVTGSVAARAWECGGGRVYGPREVAAWVGGPRFPHLQRVAWGGGPWRCVGPHQGLHWSPACSAGVPG